MIRAASSIETRLLRRRAALLAGALFTLLGPAVEAAEQDPTEIESSDTSDQSDPIAEPRRPVTSAVPAGESAGKEVPKPPRARETLPGGYPEATGMFDGQGFWAGTPDRSYTLRMSGFMHFDSRLAGHGAPDGPDDTVFLRRTRIALDGRFLKEFEFRFMWDTLLSPFRPYDWHLDWRPRHELNFRVGGFKSPFGFERRGRAYALLFNDRAFPTSLAPNREIGLFVYGQTQDGFFSYDVNVGTGAENLGTNYGFRETPEFSGRVYFQPFRIIEGYPKLRNLGIGFSWTLGTETGTEDDHRLSLIRTIPRRNAYGFRTLFDHLRNEDGTTVAWGLRDRQSIHGHWHHGQFNTLFEYVRSAQRVARGLNGGDAPDHQAYLAHHAWQGVFSYTLNKDDRNTFFGVYPARPFDLSKGHWGGATVSVRYQELYIDRQSFPLFADPDRSVRGARAVATSLQWHINKLMELQFDVEYMVPRGGAPGGGHMAPELSAMTRMELRY